MGLSNQSNNPPPNPKSSYSSAGFGSYFFFGAYLGASFLGASLAFGYCFPPAAGAAGPESPTFFNPSAIKVWMFFPFKAAIALLRSSSETLAETSPRTFLISAAPRLLI